ncbi:MAG: bifunctional adenosylcobinamide kinase/adenosylcobinamide-phosphate guanylyltransferase [Burkholderiales bacterium]
MAHELILGGQRSGKSRCAEQRAAAWLAQPGCSALLLATALALDPEMRSRINRHQTDRASHVPGLGTLEVPLDLAAAVREHSAPQRLLLIDCLTLWWTNLVMPVQGTALPPGAWADARESLCAALRAVPGPVVLVSNEIGMGVSPMSPEARGFVDGLGWLHQSVAAACANVTMMVAGIEVPVKRGSA